MCIHYSGNSVLGGGPIPRIILQRHQGDPLNGTIVMIVIYLFHLSGTRGPPDSNWLTMRSRFYGQTRLAALCLLSRGKVRHGGLASWQGC